VLAPVTVTAGQSLVIFHKGQTGDPAVTDTQGNTWATISNVGAVSNNCINFEYVLAPLTGADTVTAHEPNQGSNNGAYLCTVNNLGLIDNGTGTPYTAGATAITGTNAATLPNDTLFGLFYTEATSPAFSGASSNNVGAGTPTDLGPIGSNAFIAIGAATEPAVVSQNTSLQRAFTPTGNFCGGIVALAPSVPHVSVVPNTLAFGSVTVGQTSAAQSVTISNVQAVPLNFTSITISPASYAISANTCGASIGAGANCSVSVTFTPASQTTVNGSLTVVDNGP
jgi:hypothetical protein